MDKAGREVGERREFVMPVQFNVSMVKGKVPSYPMAGKIWEGVEADAEDEDEEQLLPAIVYLWVQRDGPTAAYIVKGHTFTSDAAKKESLRLATSYDS